MNLAEAAIKKPVFPWMVIFGVILFGVIGYRELGISQMPDVDFPVLDIDVTWEGAAPEVMETDVVDIIEDAMMGIEGLREISSNARQSQANITLEFELDRDIDVALQEAQSKLLEVQRRLPRDIDPPVIRKKNPEDQPIMWIGVSSTGPLKELMEYVDRHIKDQFKTIPGVGEVFLGGFIEPNLRIWINPEKLEAYELTVEDVIRAVQEEHLELPAGEIETQTTESRVRVMGEADTVAEFEKMMINYRGGQPMYRPIPLKEVALIEDGLADIRRISRINGERSVGLGIRKQRGANAVETGRMVRERVRQLQETVPPGYEIGINFDSTVFIEDSVDELVFTLILSGLLTSLICWLFLGSISATFNVILGIPFSILGTFLCIRFLNYTLNTFTLLGLTLAIGIIVDDAIMILENIVRHRQMGKSRVQAALDGARQITPAAIVASTAVVAIFIPVIFMKGVIGKFFFQFGIIITIAIALSLFEAISFSPMRCSQFLYVGPRKTAFGKAFERLVQKTSNGYRAVLELALRHRILVLMTAGGLFALSLLIIPALRKEFIPAQDQSMFIGRLRTPVGSSMEFTNERFKQLEAKLMERPETRRYLVAIGGFGAGGRSNMGNIFISMKRPEDRPPDPQKGRPLTQEEFMAWAREAVREIPDLRGGFQDLSTRGFVADRGFPVEFTVRGPDWDKLAQYAKTVQEEMEKNPIFVDVDTDYQEGMPEVRITPDRDKAFERGVSVNSVARTINALIAGERISKYTRGGRRYDVRIRVKPEHRTHADDIAKLLVRNNRGEMVRLAEVVEIHEEPSLLSITRRGRERAIAIYANVASGRSQAAAIDEARLLGQKILPKSYRLVFGGTSQTFQESFDSLLFALWLGIIVAYLVLASQFNHLLHPLTVLLAVPFSISGALLALWMGNQSLNIFSMIGLLLLIGIVKKNSILLVEFTNQLREEGMDPLEALKNACPIRFRPVLMTSVSTIAAALPPALALGPGAETRIPMAIAIIGGVTVSTLLTLVVVPCAYYLFVPLEKKNTWLRLFRKKENV